MSEELSIEILKQATLGATTGACEKCPRKDKNKTCIGCLDKAKKKVLDDLQQKDNIIKEVREYITTINDEDIQYTIGWVKQDILEILDKENKDIELDMLKALNTDLDDDVEMG